MTLNAENTTFSIAGRGLKLDTAEDVEDFVNSILSRDNLEKVILSGNTFGVEAAQAIAKALEQKKTLKVFDASDIFTGRLREEIPHAVKALCDSLEDKQLVELNFSDNAFGPAGVEPMVDFLTNNRWLKILKLNNNGLGPGGGKLIAKALLGAAEKNAAEGHESSLTTIIAGRNRLENGSIRVLADAIAAHGTLTEIRIPQNGIRSEGIIALSKGLAACKNLQILDLQDNTFTESGSKAFSKALVEWPKLKFLNIGDCLLSADGGVIIAETLLLGHNKDLEHLNLQYNEINSKGVGILASAVSSHLKKLESLELNGNNVNPEDGSIQNLISALKENGYPNALGELNDMEYSEEEEGEEDEEDLAEPPSIEKPSVEEDETEEDEEDLAEPPSIEKPSVEDETEEDEEDLAEPPSIEKPSVEDETEEDEEDLVEPPSIEKPSVEEDESQEGDIENREEPPRKITIVNSQEVHVDSVIEIKSLEIKLQDEDHGIQKTVVEVNREIYESVREKDKSLSEDTADVGQPSIPAEPETLSREVANEDHGIQKTVVEVNREIHESVREKDKSLSEDTADVGQPSIPAEPEALPRDVANDNNIREAIPEVKLQEVDRDIHEGDRGVSENASANEQVEALTERVSRCHYL